MQAKKENALDINHIWNVHSYAILKIDWFKFLARTYIPVFRYLQQQGRYFPIGHYKPQRRFMADDT